MNFNKMKFYDFFAWYFIIFFLILSNLMKLIYILVILFKKGFEKMKAEYFIQEMIEMITEVQIDLLVKARNLDNEDIQIYNLCHKKGDLFMYNDKITLTPQEILDKEFKIDARGYRPQEVDKFLDLVINDYNEFITEMKTLRRELAYVNDENTKLKNELRRIKANIEAAEESGSNNSVSNVDLLRRLSQLEKVVYGKSEE